MRTETQTIRIGENMGPIDWAHSMAQGKPDVWRQAERSPADFKFNGRPLLAVAMYDGWPYWKPTPAIQFIGPLNSAEWTFFNSYGVDGASIQAVRK